MGNWCLNSIAYSVERIADSKKLNAKRYPLNAKVFCSVVLILILIMLSDIVFAIESRTFDGRIDFLHKDISLCLDLKDSGKLEVSGNVEGERYNLKLKLRHLKFGRSDLSTDFYASGVILKGADGRIKSIKGKA